MDADARRVARRASRAARHAVVGEVRDDAERRIASHLRSMLSLPGRAVGLTVADDGEPDLAAFADHHRAMGGLVALPVPAVATDDHTMCFRLWRATDELQPGRYGIPCPPDGPDRVITPDVVLVPLVAFDPTGNRLGRGAGFYDRWLGEHDVAAIGVAFEAQRRTDIEPAPHDVPLDAVVTELGIRWFRPMETA